MEKTYVLWLVVISFFLTNIVAFLDEGLYSFKYLTRLGDWVAIIIYTALFLLIPFLIFFWIKKSEKVRFINSLFGFAPVFF